ncbi:12248_t:CDS:2, partial [Rhizophagus irregularis]
EPRKRGVGDDDECKRKGDIGEHIGECSGEDDGVVVWLVVLISKLNKTTDSDERVAIHSPVYSSDNDNDDMDFQYNHKDDLSFQDINDDNNAYGSINPQNYNDEIIFSQDNVNSSNTEEEEESDNEYNYEEEEEEEDNNENNDEEEEKE